MKERIMSYALLSASMMRDIDQAKLNQRGDG